MKSGRCYWCNADGPLTVDHVNPKSMGGKGGKNLVLACETCNQERGLLSSFHLRVIRLFSVKYESDAKRILRSLWKTFRRKQIGRLAQQWRLVEANRGVAIVSGLVTHVPSITQWRQAR